MNRLPFSSSPAIFCIALFAAGILRCQGGIITETRTFTEITNIPDLQDPPLVFKHSISDSAIYSLNKVEVGLHLAGDPVGSGWASEMFVGINKDLTTSATILNQPGVTTADLLGAGYNGWNVTFSDTGLNGDIQTYLGNYGGPTLTGEWRPAEALSIFGGAAANGDWLLSVADLNLGGTMRLESWSLTFVGVTTSVPETDSTVLLLGIGLLAIAGCRRINGASVTRKRGL